jgi:hypothetical protein
MNFRSMRLGAAALVTVAFAACSKPADTPAVIDSAANATQTVAPAIDSAAKVDSAVKPAVTKPDSAKPIVDTPAPVKK